MTRPLALISATAFLLMLGLSVLFPVLPFYIRWLGLTEFDAGVMVSSYALASVLTAPLWGRFSERFGRKPALLIGLVGFSLAFGLFGLGRSFWELLGARALGGVLAAAALPAIMSYTVDITPPERRSTALGVVGAAFGSGTLFGPVVGGLLGDIHLRLPFFVTAGIGVAAASAVALWLPESLSPGLRQQARRRREQLDQQGLGMTRIATGLAAFLVYIFLIQTGRTGLESTIGFLIADRLSGGTRSVGYLLGGIAVMAVAVQGGGIRVLSKVYSDHALMIAGTVLLTGGLLGLGFAQSWAWMITCAGLLAVGAALLTPAFTAELSRAAEAVQGEAQGLNSSAQSLGRAVGPLIFTSLYQTQGTVVPYLTAAACCAIGLAIAARRLRASLPGAKR